MTASAARKHALDKSKEPAFYACTLSASKARWNAVLGPFPGTIVSQTTGAMHGGSYACVCVRGVMHRPLTLMLKVLRISSGDLPAVQQQQHSAAAQGPCPAAGSQATQAEIC